MDFAIVESKGYGEVNIWGFSGKSDLVVMKLVLLVLNMQLARASARFYGRLRINEIRRAAGSIP